MSQVRDQPAQRVPPGRSDEAGEARGDRLGERPGGLRQQVPCLLDEGDLDAPPVS